MSDNDKKSPRRLAREVLDIEIEGLRTVRDRLEGDDSLEQAVGLIAGCAGRVVVTGLGKSGLVGRKIAATLSSTGTPAYFLHPVEGAHGDLGLVGEKDVIVAISNSGETDELNAILPALRSLGARLIAMTGKPGSTLGLQADVVLNTAVPREACPLDLAPTASTTACLAVGDALAICLMDCKNFGEQEFRRVHPAGALGRRLSLRAKDLMHTDGLPTAPASVSLGEALQALHRGGIGAVLLLDADARLQGILTDGDVRRLAVDGRLEMDRPAAGVMISNPCYGMAEQTAGQLLDIMEEKSITVLPILDTQGVLSGVVHLHDLLGKGRLKFGG